VTLPELVSIVTLISLVVGLPTGVYVGIRTVRKAAKDVMMIQEFRRDQKEAEAKKERRAMMREIQRTSWKIDNILAGNGHDHDNDDYNEAN